MNDRKMIGEIYQLFQDAVMQLRLLHYFVTLAREQHFARAAEICGVTQPALSAGLHVLETQFGKRLVVRDRRFVRLSEEGADMPFVERFGQELLGLYPELCFSVRSLISRQIERDLAGFEIGAP
jgi:Bacterial regulatory helix-turn-helix protein, lysR family